MTRRWESWAACPGPGHPLAQFRSRPRESRLLPGPWEAGDPPPACAQPGAPASYPISRASPCGGGGTGSESPGLGCCKFYSNSQPQILQQFPRRGVASTVPAGFDLPTRPAASERGRQRFAGDPPGVALGLRLPELDMTVLGLVFA